MEEDLPRSSTTTSPVIRSDISRTPQPITPKQVRKIVHDLYRGADLLKEVEGGMYNLT